MKLAILFIFSLVLMSIALSVTAESESREELTTGPDDMQTSESSTATDQTEQEESTTVQPKLRPVLKCYWFVKTYRCAYAPHRYYRRRQ